MLRWLLFVAFAVRLLAGWIWQQENQANDTLFRFGDSQTYWVLASKVARGQPYEYGGPDSQVFRAPLYPLAIAPATYFPGLYGVLAARAIGVFLGTVSVAIIWCATRELHGNHAAFWAAFFASFYPGAIGMSIFVLSEALFCPLVLGSLWLASRLLSDKAMTWDWKHQWMHALASGALCGLACLTRPSFFLWPLFAMSVLGTVYGWKRMRDPESDARRRSFLRWGGWSLSFGVGMVVVMSPWWWRNYLVTGHFVPTTLQVGASLLDGLHAGASGGSDEGMAFVLPYEQALRAEWKERDASNLAKPPTHRQHFGKSENFEWQLNQRLLAAATTWALQNRSDACRLALVKFAKMWTPWPTAREVGGWGVRVAESIAYLAIMLLASVTVCVVRERRWMIWLYVLPLFYFALLHLVFASSVRYRQPAILVLCVLAGSGAAWMLERILKRNASASTRKP